MFSISKTAKCTWAIEAAATGSLKDFIVLNFSP